MRVVRHWVLATTISILACGPEKPPESPIGPNDASKGETSEDAGAVADQAGKTRRVGSTKLVDRREKNGLAADTLDQMKSNSAPPPKSSADIYKSVAPATVIVRVGGGFGSGIVIHPDGWILTNHHVIASGDAEDFKFKAKVQLGHIDPKTGAMERDAKEYEAFVHKADKLRDIALLKLSDPPKRLPSVKIAQSKPVPGADVVALGHAGAGMLWALKSGQISAMGKLAETLAQLAAFDDSDEGKEAREQFKKYVEEANLGLIIQSTCNILPGDSGGPLLNAHGELIGLNVFARRDFVTGGLLSFHVHLDEIAKFANERPAHPAQLLPDPWDEGGGDLTYEDGDLDGRVDLLMMAGRKPCSFCPPQSQAVFIDADQDSYKGRDKLPDLDEVYDMRDFDAEIAYLQLENDAYIWYDTDDDGKFDVLMYDQGTTGLVSAGYRIDKDGVLARNDDWQSSRPFQVALFQNAAIRDRLARVTRAAFPERYTDAPEAVHQALPAPIPRTGRAYQRDLDGDGRYDALDVSTSFSTRLLIDTDRSFVPTLEHSFNVAEKSTKDFDPEVAVVSQTTHMWVFYDTDDDGRMDLVLHAPGTRLYAAVEAFTIDTSGKRTPAPEHVGRMLIRPALVGGALNQSGLSAMVGKGLLDIMSARGGDGLASFPHPIKDHRGTAMELVEIKGAPKSTVAIMGYGSDGYLVDLDGSSRLLLSKPKDDIDIEDIVTSGKFDAEFAYFQRNGLAWAYYDRDNDKQYDTILVATDIHDPKVVAAFEIEGDAARHAPDLVSGALIRPSLLKNARMKATLEKLADELFSDTMLE
jgi:S1-C subfamily serine protease